MQSKFKVGDRVQLVRITNLSGEDVSHEAPMLIGIIATIIRVFDVRDTFGYSARDMNGYKLDCPELNIRFYTDEELELVPNALQRLKKRYGKKKV